ncbi:MAG: hypothetical protein HYZ44_16310 [Bacteroidetes bacterium]|nr:hypothetical protein [Bacteroidota bacterium]
MDKQGNAQGWGDPAKWDNVKRLFGDMDKEGTLIVFDAIPLEAPMLKVDIMNPHYGEYYENSIVPKRFNRKNVMLFV